MKHEFLVDPRGNLQHLIDGEVRATVPSTHAELYRDKAEAAEGRTLKVLKVDTLMSVAYPPEAERALLASKVAAQDTAIADLSAKLAALTKSAAATSAAKT